MTRVGRPDCLVDLRLYKYGRPARAILGKQGGGKYSVFLVELRALALAVLVVQVCCCACGASVLVLCLRCKCAAENAVTCKFCTVFVSIASLQRLAMPILSTSAAASKSRDVNLQLAACKDTSQQTRNAHAAV